MLRLVNIGGNRPARRGGFLACFLFWYLQNASSTEVTGTVEQYDDSLGIKIALPVLVCHSKDFEYKEVRWYKDSTLLKNGSNDPPNHQLFLKELLKNDFDNLLKLQGYYWCETDQMKGPAVKYLYRIKEVNTFIGSFVATEDSFGDDDEFSLDRKIDMKKNVYETEMQTMLFGFLPSPNTYVTDISKLKTGGLLVHFYLYLYFRRLVDPRKLYTSELVHDQEELESVLDYLYNKTSEVDKHQYLEILDWTHLRGIDIEKISLKSTLGCYQNKGLVPAEPPREITWPYAEIGEVVIPKEGCSSKNGLAVTRLCNGSFNSGAEWGKPSGECNMLPNNLTTELRDIYNSNGDFTKDFYQKKLKRLTSDPSKLTVTDLHILINILTKLSTGTRIPTMVIDDMFSLIDKMSESNKTELEAAKSTIKFTSRLIKILSNTLETRGSREVYIAKPHILMDTKNTREGKDHVVGLSIISPSTSESNNSLFLLEGGDTPKQDSLAYFLLPPELLFRREDKKTSIQVTVVYFKNWLLFPKPEDVLKKGETDKVLPSAVMYVSITGGPAWNLKNPVHLYFKNTHGQRIKNPVCVQFDPRLKDGEGAWDSEGCEYGGLKNGFYSCLCHHLSIFSVVLLDGQDSYFVGLNSIQFRLGTAVYIGCAASIIALSFTIVLYCLSKVWRKTIDHSVLFWLSLSLLCFVVLLFVSETRFTWKHGCRLTAFLLHYVVLVIACWLLVMAFMHKLRFANKTDMNEVPHFIFKAVLVCWGFASFIITVIWLANDYKAGKADSCYKTLFDVSRWSLIPVVVILLIALCFNMCAIYAVTCRFKQDYLIGNLGYDESVLKFRVAFTIYFFFVMSYIFGVLALQKRSKVLRILFSISMTLTAYYLTLFFVFQEVSLWDMCRKWKKRRTDESGTVKYDASSKRDEESDKK